MVVSRPEFELTGGDLALDFANTLSRRLTAEPREDLREYEDLVEWGTLAGAIDPGEAGALRSLAARSPRTARAALSKARAVREALFEAFDAVARRRPVAPGALKRVNDALAGALGRLRLGPGGDGWTWTGPLDLDRVLWPVARAAAHLLTSPDRALVRECGASDCAWLFLDRSRNGTRRWCDMAVCGNREKARRFQERSRRRG
jgi:predicted RNA-binding Zn ribbon-like protein